MAEGTLTPDGMPRETRNIEGTFLAVKQRPGEWAIVLDRLSDEGAPGFLSSIVSWFGRVLFSIPFSEEK